MASDWGDQARENAEDFGENVKDAVEHLGAGLGALHGDTQAPEPEPEDTGGGDVIINVNQ